MTDKRYKQENLPDTKVGGFSQVGRSERWVGGSFGKLAIKLAVFSPKLAIKLAVFFPVETPPYNFPFRETEKENFAFCRNEKYCSSQRPRFWENENRKIQFSFSRR